jgi:hypothetical protein
MYISKMDKGLVAQFGQSACLLSLLEKAGSRGIEAHRARQFELPSA